jgi:hypothetical protein
MQCTTEEASGGVDDGCVDAPRDAGKKLLTPGARRDAVTWAIENKGYSQRRACDLVGMAPRVYRLSLPRIISARSNDAVLIGSAQ